MPDNTKLIHWEWRKFSELTVDELYKLLKLRSDVFVVEQTCIYADLDNNDQKAMHLLGWQDDEIVAYLRVLKNVNEGYISFGRVVTAPTVRGTGIGHLLISTTINYLTQHYPHKKIKISAQHHLEKFYNRHGLIAEGEPYDEVGISHIAMIKK